MKAYYKVKFVFSEDCSKAVSRDLLIDTFLETDNEMTFNNKPDVDEYLEALKKTKFISIGEEDMVIEDIKAFLDKSLMLYYNVVLIDVETYHKKQIDIDDFLSDL